MTSSELFDRLISILLPQRCVICGELVEYEDYWCEKCGTAEEVPYTRLGQISCEIPHSFAGAIAAIEYSAQSRQMILRLKSQGDRRIIQFFANEMSAVITQHWDDIRFELIVPVPSSTGKLKDRGFNQAERLARYLGKSIGVAVQSEALMRHENTQSQQGLSAQERRDNAEKSYDIGKCASYTTGKVVLLVDDVFTTGSTAAACAEKLLNAGAQNVYIVTAAHQKQLADDNDSL